MRVCFFGFFDNGSPRNTILRRGLEHSGVEVIPCRPPAELWPAHARPGAAVLRKKVLRAVYELGELRRTLARSRYLRRRFRDIERNIDCIIVPEFNQGSVPLARVLSRRYHIPIIVDFQASLFETAVISRGLLRPNRPRARLRRLLDVAAIRLADLVIVDTQTNVDHFDSMFGGLARKARVVPLGFPDWEYSRRPLTSSESDQLVVLYYGYFNPLHGVPHILEAASQLADDKRFHFLLAGSGQMRDELEAEYARRPSGNVTFAPMPGRHELNNLIASSDICLGIFGEAPIAQRVVPNKVWQCLAVGRPVISCDGAGPRSVFEDGTHCLLVPHSSPSAIREALLRLADDSHLRRKLAQDGADLVHERYTSAAVGRRLIEVIREAIEPRRS